MAGLFASPCKINHRRFIDGNKLSFTACDFQRSAEAAEHAINLVRELALEKTWLGKAFNAGIDEYDFIRTCSIGGEHWLTASNQPNLSEPRIDQ